jgi:protein-S-isoprenylcysteine O-methyltransferase Ste14
LEDYSHSCYGDPDFLLPLARVIPPKESTMLITVEENMLEKTFAEAWVDYKKQVRRWI